MVQGRHLVGEQSVRTSGFVLCLGEAYLSRGYRATRGGRVGPESAPAPADPAHRSDRAPAEIINAAARTSRGPAWCRRAGEAIPAALLPASSG